MVNNRELYRTKQRAHYVIGGELCLFTVVGSRVMMTWNPVCGFLYFPRGMDMDTAIEAVIERGGPTKYVDWRHTDE